jgi:hypothetical protein
VVAPSLAIGEDADGPIYLARPELALYIGDMGARGHNFSKDLACRYGHESAAAAIQDLWSGRRDEAAAAVPTYSLRATSLIGPASSVAEHLAAFLAAGVTTLQARPALPHTTAQRLTGIENVRRRVS